MGGEIERELVVVVEESPAHPKFFWSQGRFSVLGWHVTKPPETRRSPLPSLQTVQS